MWINSFRNASGNLPVWPPPLRHAPRRSCQALGLTITRPQGSRQHASGWQCICRKSRYRISLAAINIEYIWPHIWLNRLVRETPLVGRDGLVIVWVGRRFTYDLPLIQTTYICTCKWHVRMHVNLLSLILHMVPATPWAAVSRLFVTTAEWTIAAAGYCGQPIRRLQTATASNCCHAPSTRFLIWGPAWFKSR